MKLSQDQLRKYNEGMIERIKKASETDHIIHGYMIYQCEECADVYVMWLEKGLEDPEDDKKTGNHKSVPYTIICPFCGGMIKHILWELSKNTLSSNYKSYNRYVTETNGIIYRNFFWNDPESDCGVPVIQDPDYFGDSRSVMSSIYLNTLPEEQKEVMRSFMATDAMLECEMEVSALSVVIDGNGNRESRRHPNGNNRYKRPKSNKKLYEY